MVENSHTRVFQWPTMLCMARWSIQNNKKWKMLFFSPVLLRSCSSPRRGGACLSPMKRGWSRCGVTTGPGKFRPCDSQRSAASTWGSSDPAEPPSCRLSQTPEWTPSRGWNCNGKRNKLAFLTFLKNVTGLFLQHFKTLQNYFYGIFT